MMAGFCIAKLFYPEIGLGNYSEFATAVIAICAFIITCLEYFSHKDSNKAKVFSEYNQRYSTDPNIVNVVKYLNSYNPAEAQNQPQHALPSNYEVEMFMRFIEELDLQIEYNRLKEEDVFDLFIYYAKVIGGDERLRNLLGVTDYPENWKRFENIVDRYNQAN